MTEREPVCELFCYDEQKVNRVKDRLSRHDFRNMAELFKVLADPTRLSIACALCEENELCVCDVANIIGCTLATASHHLRLLRNMGIADCRKAGKLVFYRLKDERLRPLVRQAGLEPEEAVFT